MITNVNLVNQVTAFINLEADLLDYKEYQDWLSLWADDGMYIIPVDHTVEDYAHSLNVAYDDAEMREMRVRRLTSGEAVSTSGVKYTARTVSRIRVLDEADDSVSVRCAYCLFEDNKTGIRQFPANVEFKLLKNGDSFLIKEKIVKLMKSDQYLATISYLF